MNFALFCECFYCLRDKKVTQKIPNSVWEKSILERFICRKIILQISSKFNASIVCYSLNTLYQSPTFIEP